MPDGVFRACKRRNSDRVNSLSAPGFSTQHDHEQEQEREQESLTPAEPTGLEPATSAVTGQRSNQLS
jgi:hypothetical protein